MGIMNKKVLYIGVSVLILAGIGAVAFSMFKNNTPDEPAVQEDVFVASTPEPTPEPTIAFEKSDFDILVLNGSGKVGAAGTMKTALEDADYVVSDTGNAEEYGIPNTLIQVTSDIPQGFIDQLISDLTAAGYAPELSGAPDDENEDVVVTVGLDGGEPAPTTKPAAKEKTDDPTPEEDTTPTPSEEPTPTTAS